MIEHIRLLDTVPKVFNGCVPMDPVSDLWGCDLVFDRGKSYLVTAASGRGKSSFCSFVYGLRDDYDGKILFDDRDLREIKSQEWNKIRQSSLGVMFQDLRLFGELNAVDNVMVKSSLTSFADRKRIVEMLSELGLANRLDRPCSILSFGQQQRVAFVRMLCQKADFWLLDEPVSHLDHANAECMSQMLSYAAGEIGAGVIVTTIGHDLPYEYDKVLNL